MNRLRMLLARGRSLFRSSGRLDTELDAEMSAHLDLLADEHRRRGLSPDDARAAARRDFGSVAQIKDTYRDQRGIPFLDALAQDVRYAIRSWRRQPGFNAVVIVVLALGIGVNSAIFTVVDAMLFRPLAGRVSELVGVYSRERTQPDSYRSFSYPEFIDVRDHADVFESVTAHTFAMVGLPAGDVTRKAFVEVVSANYFSTLGVQLAAGRAFSVDEERPGANAAVAVVGFNRWKQQGFDPGLLGRTTRINTQDFVIVGVAPEGFTGTTLLAPDMWVPLGMFDSVVNDVYKNNGSGLGSRANRGLTLAGRLKPGLSLTAANARLDDVSSGLEQAYPAENRNELLIVSPLSRTSLTTQPHSDTGPAALAAVVMPLSGAVLLIACLNLANMFLARGSARRKEIAIRLALGGGRRRIIRQLVTESLLLALVGGAAGLLLGTWTISALVSSLAGVLPLKIALHPWPDLNVTLVALFLAVGSTLVFGLAPALKISRPDVVGDLKELGVDHRGSSLRLSTRAWLVVGQIAMSLMLLTSGGLFAHGALKAADATPGYRYDGLLLASVDPGLAGFDEARGRATLLAALDRVRSLPGVKTAAMTSQVPFGNFHMSMPIERPGAQTGTRFATYSSVSAGYFAAAGLPLLRGRDFDQTEERIGGGPRVAIIDEPLARLLFPDEDPLGRQIRPASRRGGRATEDTRPFDIVGVVPGVRDDLFEVAAGPHVYVPFGSSYQGAMHVFARLPDAGAATGADMLKTIRRELAAVDSRLPLIDLMTMRDFHDGGLLLWVIHTAARMFGTFGALALLLAAVGIYGLKSYVVSQRTREIGIRMAVGARPVDILLLIVRDSARTTAIGLAIGFPFALGLGVLLSTEIYDVSPFDPLILALAPAVLVAATALATYVPARRATRITPLDALRAE